MLDALKRLFSGRLPQSFEANKPKAESIETLPPSVAGSQRSLETEQHRYLVPQFGLIHPFDLNEYLELFVTDPLAFCLVSADTNLTSAELEYNSASDEVNEYVRDFNRRVDLDRSLWELYRDVSLYGFGGFEIIGNASTLQTSTEIIALRRIDPRYLFIQKNPLGRIEKFYQRPLNSPYAISLNTPFGIPLNPESIIYAHSLSPLTSYGQSILQPLKARLQQRNDLIAAAVQAHKNHASAVHWLQYTSHPDLDEVKEEIDSQIAAMNRATDSIDETGTRWLLSGGTGTYSHTMLAASQIPDSAPILKELTDDVIRAAGFHPSMLGQGDAQDGESARYTVNNIITKQRNLMTQLHAKLYMLLPFVEPACPASNGQEIIVRMTPPDEQTFKEELEAEAIRINNVGLQLRMGAISDKKAAQLLGLDGWHDEELLDEWLSGPEEEPSNDPNEVQQTRAKLARRNDGKNPGNNPSGTK